MIVNQNGRGLIHFLVQDCHAYKDAVPYLYPLHCRIRFRRIIEFVTISLTTRSNRGRLRKPSRASVKGVERLRNAESVRPFSAPFSVFPAESSYSKVATLQGLDKLWSYKSSGLFLKLTPNFLPMAILQDYKATVFFLTAF